MPKITKEKTLTKQVDARSTMPMQVDNHVAFGRAEDLPATQIEDINLNGADHHVVATIPAFDIVDSMIDNNAAAGPALLLETIQKITLYPGCKLKVRKEDGTQTIFEAPADQSIEIPLSAVLDFMFYDELS